ncbi:MAG: hypothetical protein OXN89_01045 [Bryobacterales bacterium]|nr:hypothetical protein [Bryobacterales bacterium]
MKWVARATRIIVASQEGRAAYTSPAACPPVILKHVKTVLRGAPTRSVMVANREALVALRRNGSNEPARPQPEDKKAVRPLRWLDIVLSRWGYAVAGILLVAAAIAFLLAWTSAG